MQIGEGLEVRTGEGWEVQLVANLGRVCGDLETFDSRCDCHGRRFLRESNAVVEKDLLGVDKINVGARGAVGGERQNGVLRDESSVVPDEPRLQMNQGSGDGGVVAA